MTCPLGAGTVSMHGQKLSPWTGTLGWVVGNVEMRGDDMSGGVGGRCLWMGESQLVQGMSRTSSLIVANILRESRETGALWGSLASQPTW